MKWLLITLLLLLGEKVYAQEVDTGQDTLSDKWTVGPFLIYDCDDRHWVCVHDLGQAQCESQREQKIKSGAMTLGCAPGKKFASKQDCWVTQRQMVNEAIYPRTCIHPKARKRLIGFR